MIDFTRCAVDFYKVMLGERKSRILEYSLEKLIREEKEAELGL